MSDSCVGGRKLRTLNILDGFSRECLAIIVERALPSSKVIATLDALAFEKGLPEVITVSIPRRSYRNGPYV